MFVEPVIQIFAKIPTQFLDWETVYISSAFGGDFAAGASHSVFFQWVSGVFSPNFKKQ